MPPKDGAAASGIGTGQAHLGQERSPRTPASQFILESALLTNQPRRTATSQGPHRCPGTVPGSHGSRTSPQH